MQHGDSVQGSGCWGQAVGLTASHQDPGVGSCALWPLMLAVSFLSSALPSLHPACALGWRLLGAMQYNAMQR